jgi:hypothetical protein
MAQQTIGIGSAPNDGTGDPIRDAFDKCNDNFTELYTGLTGLLDFKGSTDASANPNYPAASKGDFYVISVAGKIGGASGADVEVGDAYFATADNAGGTQAAVGSSWTVIQGNTTGAGSGVTVEDEGSSEGTGITTLNFTGAGVSVSVTGSEAEVAIAGGGSGVDVEDEGVAEASGATVLNFTGAGVTATDVGGGQVDIDIPGGGGALIVDRVFISATNTTFTINNASYTSHFESLSTAMELTAFPATHFRVVAFGQSSEAAQTVTFQLDTTDGGGTPASAGGNDLVITNTQGLFDSGWIARADGLTGFQRYFGLLKGSNATVDLNLRHLTVMWKID